MIDFNKLTEQTRNTVLASQEVMRRYKNAQILPEHLLIAMLEDEQGQALEILKKLNLNISLLKEEIEKILTQEFYNS